MIDATSRNNQPLSSLKDLDPTILIDTSTSLAAAAAAINSQAKWPSKPALKENPLHYLRSCYSVFASTDTHDGVLYAGPPPGFHRKGRNLLFLRKTATADVLEVEVPVYETAIRLAQTPDILPIAQRLPFAWR